MSIFKVKLTNSRQGLLDVHDNQRTAYIMGPNRVNRKLKDGETYSGKFSYKGLLPNIGDEVVLTVVQNKGKDDKLYWNITDIVVAKSCPQDSCEVVANTSTKEKSIIAQCLTKIVFGDKGGEPQAVFDCYQNFIARL